MPAPALTPAERTELARACRDPDAFHSDGREVLWACIVVPFLCLPLLAVLSGDARAELRQINAGELTVGIGLLFNAPELLGFLTLLGAALAVVAYGAHTFRRHGIAITSFGVARLRGGVKTLIRYPDLASVTFAERRYPVHRVITDELELKATDGRVIMLYGFHVARRKQRIEAQWLRPAAPTQ